MNCGGLEEITDMQNLPEHNRNQMLGSWRIVFLVVSAAAPLTGMLGAVPAAITMGNGAGLPGAYLLAGIILLLFSAGFTAMSRHVTEAGAFYAYIGKGFGASVGFGSALVALGSYTAVQIALYALFGFFCGSVISEAIPWFVYALAALAVVQVLGLRNLDLNSRLLGILMTLEMGILVVLAGAIVLHGGGPEGLTLKPFMPSEVFGGHLGIAVMFAMASFLGFEATAIYAQDCRAPERTIPRATYTAVILIAVFFTFVTWSIVCAYGSEAAVTEATNDPANFWFKQAAIHLGPSATLAMSVLLLSSIFASILAFHNALSRYFVALGRDGWLPPALAEIDPTFHAPRVASFTQTGSALLGLLVFAVSGCDPYAVVFSWMSAFATLGILGLQTLVSVSVLLYFRRAAGPKPIWTTVVAPLLSGVGLFGVLCLLIANLPALSGSESPYLNLLPVAMLALMLIGIVVSRLRAAPAGLGRAAS